MYIQYIYLFKQITMISSSGSFKPSNLLLCNFWRVKQTTKTSNSGLFKDHLNFAWDDLSYDLKMVDDEVAARQISFEWILRKEKQ